MAAAATSILPLYGVPAFADSAAGHACGSSSDKVASLDRSFEKHCDAGPNPRAAHEFGPSEGYTHFGRSHLEGHAGDEGRAGDEGYGDEAGYGDEGYGEKPGYGEEGYGDKPGYGDEGYGEDAGYGDDGYGEEPGYGDDGYGEEPGYGDTSPPVTTPPATPPHTPPVTTPPASPSPTKPPALADTGSEEQVIVASGLAAILLTSGVVMYRRGRGGAHR